MSNGEPAQLSISAGFCSTHTKHFQEVFEDQADQTLSKLRQQGALGAKFMVFGRYDHLFVVTAEKSTVLRKVDQGLNLSREVANQWTSYGRITHSTLDSDTDIESIAPKLPLLGASFLKIKRKFSSYTGSAPNSYIAQLSDLIDKLRDGNPDLHIIASSTTGWEDIMLLVFGKTFSSIVDFIAKVRNYQFEGEEKAHLVLTSCTLPAIHLPWKKELVDNHAAREETIATLLNSIDKNDPVDWSIRFEVVPGKGKALIDSIEALAKEAGLEKDGHFLHFSSVFGQVDVSFRRAPEPGTESTRPVIGDLIHFLIHVGFPLSAQENSPARAMETMLVIDSGDYPLIASEDSGDVEEPESDSFKFPHVEASLRYQYHEVSRPVLLNLGIPKPTANVIEGLNARLDSLHGDEFLRDEFYSLYLLGRGFTKKIDSKFEKERDKSAEYAQLLRGDLSDWQTYLARCLSDRYRGRYPVGENMVVPLASHQNSYHKFLYLADVLVNQSYFLGREAINAQIADSDLSAPDKEHSSLAIIPIGVFIGDSPSPFAITVTVRELFTGFIDVSSDMVFDLRHLVCLFHEAGHFIFREFETHCFAPKPESLDSWRRSRNFLSEIFCEAFACAVGTGGNMQSYSALAHRVIHHYFPEPDMFQVGTLWKTDLIRHAASLLLDAVILPDGDQTPVSIKHTLSHLRSNFTAYWEDQIVDLTGQHSESIRLAYSGVGDALSLIANHLQYQPEFASFVCALGDMASAPNFVQFDDNANLLDTVRRFLNRDDLDTFDAAAVNFELLDDLWSRSGIAMREAQSS